jgi:hypothetical protein
MGGGKFKEIQQTCHTLKFTTDKMSFFLHKTMFGIVIDNALKK